MAVTGQDQLKRVMRGIEGESRAQATREVRTSQRVSNSRVRDAQRAAQKQQREAEKAAAAQVRAAQKVEAARIRAAEKAASKETAIQERALRKQQRDEERSLRWRQNIRNRHFQKEARDRNAAETKAQRFRERAAGSIMNGAGRIVGAGKAALMGGAAVATAAATNAVYQRAALDTQLRNVANAGFRPGGRSRDELYGAAKGTVDRIANSTGSDPEQLASALSSVMAKTGDFDTAIGALEELNNLSMATATSLEDLGSTYGMTLSSLKRAGASDAVAQADALKMARVFAGQGKFGEIEVRDLANQGGKLVGAASSFAGDRSTALTNMGALVQSAAQGGSTSAEDATTAVKNFVSDLVKKGDNIKGLNVWADKNHSKLRSADDLMAEAIDLTGGDLGKLLGTFGEQSRAILNPNLEAYHAAGGGKKGREAVKARFQTFAAQEMSQTEVGESAAFVGDSPTRRFQARMNELNQKLGDELLPKLPPLIDAIGKLTPHLTELVSAAADVAQWFSDNPFAGLGLLIGGAITAEIAKAAIGSMISSTITSALAASGVGVAGAAGAGAATTGAAAAGGGILARGGAALAGGAGAVGTALSGAGAAIAGGLSTAGAAIAAGGGLAVGALGASAVGAVGAAGYNGYKLNEEVSGENQGGFFSNLMKIIEDGKRNDAEAAKTMAEIQEMNKRAAEKMQRAADVLASAQNRTTPMSKTN